MKKLLNFIGVVAIAAPLATSLPAFADWNDDWHHRHHQAERAREHEIIREQRAEIRASDRVYLRNYINANRYYCPYGSFVRGHHCVVPHGRVAFYEPGTYLPQSVYYNELPYGVVSQLAPPPPGAVYVRADDNIYLMNRQNRVILDAINLFSGGFQ